METLAAAHQASSDLSVRRLSDSLSGTTIGLCVGGGIAAIEVPKVARELRRMGASVKIFATEAALKFVGKDALEWSSANEVIIHPSGMAEHVSQENAVLVFPATTDLIGKAAHGICPDACTTYIQSAFGKKSLVVFVPTMHDSLRNSPAFLKNIQTISEFENVSFVEPRIEEDKWKAPSPETIALEVAFRINHQRLLASCNKSPKALVTFGGTYSKIDVARTLSNLSTGTLGSIVIRKLLENGIQVTALCGQHNTQIVQCSGLEKLDSAEFSKMHEQLKNSCISQDYSGLFHLAAVSDFGISDPSDKKISSDSSSLKLNLEKLPKLISMPELSTIPFKIACKFTTSESEEDSKKAEKLLKIHNLNAVVWNWGENAFGIRTQQKSYLLLPDGKKIMLQSKENIAQAIVEQYLYSLGEAIQ